jgi:hypothetical protein
VAIPAVEPQLADVQFVAVGNGLRGTVAYVRVPRREVVPDAGGQEDWNDATADGGDER